MVGSGCDDSVIYREVFFDVKSCQFGGGIDISDPVSNSGAVDSSHGSGKAVLM